jgi:hypothetical protein
MARTMRLKIPSAKSLVLTILIIVPVAAWMIVKPIRVVAPQLFDITCPVVSVCVEDVTQLQAASQLYSEAVTFVGTTIGPITGHPKVIFCSTEVCSRSFGLGSRSAVTMGRLGTVISPRAWKPYYLRHEMIHYLQEEQLGYIKLLFMPAWFVEGMAYSLSEDPRDPLAEPFQAHRKAFRDWYAARSRSTLWSDAAKL